MYHALWKLEDAGIARVSRLPVSIRVVLESLVRNMDGKRVRAEDVVNLASWKPNEERVHEVPFVVSRVLLQDFTGVPLLVDLAAMRSEVARLAKDPGRIEPLVPVDLVVDHSVQVDVARQKNALDLNMKIEFQRNLPRYEFLKWGTGAFESFRVVPPGVGIVHQVNLEYLAEGVTVRGGVGLPDTLVGTDSHTTMINGLGIVAWGVGGIEAEAGMLGQPVYFLTPDVVGVHLHGELPAGTTATDLVLHLTEMLRKAKVVGKFVEFFGQGAESLSAAERATIANMAPEYGATMGFFPVDEETCRYFAQTGRSAEQVDLIRRYYQAQRMFGMPKLGELDYSQTLDFDLATVQPSVAGPRRPQDRVRVSGLKPAWSSLMEQAPPAGYGKHAPPHKANETNETSETRSPSHDVRKLKSDYAIADGDVVIAAITSCTNTSNPGVMLAAGLLAKNAVQRGLHVPAYVKTSLAPGSRVVTEYLQKTGLLDSLSSLGFDVVGYGCTTCIGNSGPLPDAIERAIKEQNLVVASVLSGNRNFEARVHPNVKANFLMSPPLVVAFAIAGRVDIDLTQEPLGVGADGAPVFLADVWPSVEDVQAQLRRIIDPETYRRLYSNVNEQNALWNQVRGGGGTRYEWDSASTYVREPPYFEAFDPALRVDAAAARIQVQSARLLAVFGDSITTDHISPAGSIEPTSPAGMYLQTQGVSVADFNSYGARRGNHEVMVRGTFANVRIKNRLLGTEEGGYTRHQPSSEKMSIYDAAMRYQATKTPLVIVAGHEYGTGSSRDWAAKGTRLLGVSAVVARSFERIHRSNLVGMGVLPLQFAEGTDPAALALDGTETITLQGTQEGIRPKQSVVMRIVRASGKVDEVALTSRIDTPIEVEYYLHGGILPYVLRQLLASAS
jgi:aconitate hydratase